MSISNVVVKQKYTGDTTTVAFPIPFAFIPGELSVIKVAMYDSVTKDPITPVPSYTLTPLGDTPTAVTFAVAPAATETIMVYRELPLTQVVDYIQNGSFLAESHEKGLDRIVLMIQQLADKGARALQINMFDEGALDVEIPPAIPDGVIGFNATGDALKVWSNGEFIGPAGEINSVSVAGELEYADPTPMSVTNIGTATNAQLEFVLRKGKTAEVAIGTVTTVAPTDPATVTNVGTSTNAILNFEIPKGNEGASTSLITTSTNLPNNSIGGDGDVWFVFDLLKPENGNVYQKAAGAYGLVGNIIGPPGGVNSFNSRTGSVVPTASDYDASMVDYDNTTSGLTATDLQGAVDELALNAVTTLGQAYLNSTTPQIGLNATKGAFTIDDAATPIGTLLDIRNNAGASSHFKVTSGGSAVGATTLNASAAFQVDSTTKGLLPPRMTTAQRDAISTPATGLQIFNTTTNKPNVYDGAKWSEVGSGAGAINFVTNPDGSSGTTGWTEGSYTAATRPSGNFTASSGAAKFSVSTTTTNPLGIGTTSLVFTKASGNQQGRAIETSFFLPLDYRAKVLKLSASYINTSTNATDFVAGSDTTNSDMIFYTAYSTDGGTTYTVAEPSSFKLLSNSKDNSSPYDGSYQTPYNATHLKLIAYVATTSTTAWSIKAVLGVSPSQYVYGTPITDWASYTPTGSLTTNVTYTGRMRRVGSQLEVTTNIIFGSTNTQGGIVVNLPSGLVIDTTKLDAVTNNPIGQCRVVDATGNGFYWGGVIRTGTTQVSPLITNSASTYAVGDNINTATNIPITFAAGDSVFITYSVPILGWSSSVQMSDGYDGRVIAARFSGVGAFGQTTQTQLAISATQTDTVAGLSGNTYVVKTSGYYTIGAQIGLDGVGSAGAYWQAAIRLNSNNLIFNQSNYEANSNLTRYLMLHRENIYLTAGSVIDAAALYAGTISTPGVTLNSFYITKESGSAFMSPTEEISVIATNASGLSIGVNTTISGWVKEFDSTGSFNQTTGVFTAPTAGRYEFNGFITFDTTSYSAGKEYSLALNRAGSVSASYPLASFYSIISSAVNNYLSINGSTIVDLKAGDAVSFTVYQNDGTKSLLGNSRFNRITIKRVK